jgi:hypothetical protein
MATKYWIKLYHEILDDPKMGRLPDALFRRTIKLFLIAGDFNRGGELPPLADMAWRLRADEPALYAQMEDLEALNILSRDADGGWRVVHFRERQEAAPIAERVRRHREAARNEEYTPSETCNADVTDRYTDTDADEESEKDLGADGSGLQAQAADIPTPQRLPGARAMGSVDLEFDAESGGSGMRADGLVKQFVEKTGIPLFTGGEDKWARALERMQQAGVGEADLEQAIDECRQKGLTIASLASVVNPAIIAMSRRRAGRPQEDHRRFLKGEYGEVGR